jgi:hypothetical protein
MDTAQEIELLCQHLHEPSLWAASMASRRKPGWPMDLAAMERNLPYQISWWRCYQTQEGNEAFCFLPKTWHILLLLQSVLAVWNPTPRLRVPGRHAGTEISVSCLHHFQLLGTKHSSFYFCVPIGHKSLGRQRVIRSTIWPYPCHSELQHHTASFSCAIIKCLPYGRYCIRYFTLINLLHSHNNPEA